MEFLLAVLATPVPTPSPQIIHEVTKTVTNYVTPEAVVQLFQLGAVALAGFVTSLLHLALERGKLSANVNRLIVTAYTTTAGLAYLFFTGQFGTLDAKTIETGLTALLAFLGTNQGTHMLSGFISDIKAGKAPALAAPEPEAAA